MSTPEPIESPPLGRDGEPCANCRAPLAGDQRYCLECGQRRAEARIPFMEILRDKHAPRTAPEAAAAAPPAWPRLPGPALAAAGAAAGALLVALGVLIGDDGSRPAPQPVVAQQAPPVVNVTAGAPAENASLAEGFKGDWPEGKDGWTVQLETLPSDGTQQAALDAAKSAATDKGAKDVGALLSDDHGLDPGQFVVYSGVYSRKKQAQKALKKLKKDFPDAKAIQVAAAAGADSADDVFSGKKKEATVSDDTLKELQSNNPEENQKKAAKLPDKTKTEGKAPPKDKKKPGGGSEEEVIE